MALYTKISGTWRDVRQPYIKVSNTWRQIPTVFVKVSGVWRKLHTFSWAIGAYGSCSASCGGGVMYRSVTCTRNDGLTFVDSVCTELVSAKPVTSAPCNTHDCYTYGWYASGWSYVCYCASHTATQTVYCRRSDGYSVSDSFCSGTKPASSATCTSLGLGSNCTWYQSAWSSCSGFLPANNCGQGSQTRTVRCYASRIGTGTAISDSYCTGTKPAAQQYCYNCSGCTNYWNETAVLNAKSKREGMTPAAIKQAILDAGFGSVRNWWNAYGASESVCPVSNTTYFGCCVQLGYTWYG